ncbi:MAG TPA: hypothetical protein VII45_02455 [Solirubrobacterales bacterium]
MRKKTKMSRKPIGALALCLGLLLLGLFATQASASESISEFSVAASRTQAGGHPDLKTRIRLADPGAPEVAKNITVNLPPGLFGNPGAISKCRAADFVLNQCTPGSQVGLVTLIANYQGIPNNILGTAPVYNMQTLGPNETARLAFVAPTVDIPIAIPVGVRSNSDYGLQLGISGISQQIPLGFAELTIWGFPANPEHDVERFHLGSPGSPPGCPAALNSECNPTPYPGANETVQPYTDNPSLCTGIPLPATLNVVTYQDPGHPSEKEAAYPATTGCEAQKFDPVFNLGLTTNETDSPSGLDIQLKAAQFLEGESPSPSTLRTATLTLPEGLSINPDAADGQSACSDIQVGFGTNNPGNCPDNSKIGTVEVTTPALEEPLIGSLYIGEPKPGEQYRVFMVFDGQGIHAKLFTSIQPDPATGQLTMSVTDIPQIPFEEFDLHLFASDRGLIATPTRCTLYKASATLAPWNNVLAPQDSSPFFGLTSGPGGSECPGQQRPFKPRLAAGTSNPVAGGFSAFTLKLDRDDGDQFLGKLNFTMPPGLTASLRGIGYCPEASIAAAAKNLGRTEQAGPSCPASSQIGTSNVAAGPGGHPFHAVGKVYLAGPFKGAPLSLVAVTPALAGPYDYGTVVVRVALNIDAHDAHVIADSEVVPSIIGGIPIRIRSIQVNIDKPNFMINPTNCSPFTVDSQGIGDQGTVADFSSYFQAVNCTTLPFKPKMTIAQLGSRKQTKRNQDPSLRFDLNTRPGDANLKSVAVTLPKAFAVDQRHLGNLCSRAELASKHCEGRQAIGMVETTTPLLDQPLKGPAYAVSGFGILPHIVFILGGQVTLLPEAESSSVKGGHLRTEVPTVPDAPIGHFRLTLFGGKQGYLINTGDLCRVSTVTTFEYIGQNGKTLTQKAPAKTACGSKAKRAKHKRHRR